MEPWNREKCEQDYIQGSDGNLKRLSKLSSVPMGTLKKWSTKFGWVRQRKEYQEKLATETREKTIQKTSDRLSNELSELAVEHLDSYRICRQIALHKAKWALRQLEKEFSASSTTHPESLEAEFLDVAQADAIAALDPAILNLLSLVIDRSVKGEAVCGNGILRH